MSEEEKGGSAAPEEVAGGDAQEFSGSTSSGSDSVKYDTYRRTLGEAKKYKGMVEDLQSRLNDLEQGQLASEGKKDELIDSLRKDVNEWKSKATNAVNSFAKSNVQKAMMSEASRLGCQDPDLVIKAYGNDFDSIEFDDHFNPDMDQVRMTLDRVKQERPYLFGKAAPAIGSNKINPDPNKEPEKKGLSSLKDDELMEAWAKSQR